MASLESVIQGVEARHFVVKCMEEEEVDRVFSFLNSEEGWYLSRDKLEMYCHVLQDSVYILIDSKTLEIVGCLTVVPAHSYDVCIGHMLIKKEWRRKGLGTHLLKDVVDRRMKFGQTLSLFSENDAFYEKIGFRKHVPPTVCHQIIMIPDQVSIDSYANANPLSQHTGKTIVVMYNQKSHFDSIVSYDAEAEGYENRSFLNVLFHTCSAAVVALDEDNDRVQGYATTILRPNDGILDFLGMIADSDVVAFWLFRTMLHHFPDAKKFRIQTTKDGPFLKQFGQVVEVLGGYNRLVIGDGDVTAINQKCYSLKGADASY